MTGTYAAVTIARMQITGIRTQIATSSDLEALEQMARWSDRAHLRFSLDCLSQVVNAGHITLVIEENDISGFVYATMDYPNCAIRAFVVRPGRRISSVLDAEMPYLTAEAGKLQALSISFVGDDKWLTPHLEGQGFNRDGSIISLHRPGAKLNRTGSYAYTVRQAQPEDLEAIIAVDWSAFMPLWRNGAITIAEFLEQMSHFLVACDGEKVIGYICGTQYNKIGHIVRLAVHPQYQKHGVGTRLMHDCLDLMVLTGARCLSLNTQSENQCSQAFYRSLGFYQSPIPTSVYRYILNRS